MTRLELLTILVGQARTNGFEFRRWYKTRIGLPWISAEAALSALEAQQRYYALLFSHEFAQSFWKTGSNITFQIPTQTFARVKSDGSTQVVTRKAFVRRSARKDVWRYHLREMAIAEEPLRYMRRYLNVEGELEERNDEGASISLQAEGLTETKAKLQKTRAKRSARPLPAGLPDFLKRPYRS